jgi:hypothetical protein
VRFLVTGARAWDKPHVVEQAIRDHADGSDVVIVHGACPRGADLHAARVAAKYGLVQEPHPANWQTGHGAGPARNRAMVATLDPATDLVLAFVRDGSPGTANCIREARKVGLTVIEYHYEEEDMPDKTTTPPTLIERLIAAKQAIGAVGKGERNMQQGWNFRGIDAVINAVDGPLNDHGVFTYPCKVLSVKRGTASTAKGAVMNTVEVQVEYAFTDGVDTIFAQAPGEAFDSGDKATAKAMSVAYRTALIQTLRLPTTESDPDQMMYEAERRAPRMTDEELLAAIERTGDVNRLIEMYNAQDGGNRHRTVQEAFSTRGQKLREQGQ